jgi:RNA-binding protein Tab2/Atab2
MASCIKIRSNIYVYMYICVYVTMRGVCTLALASRARAPCCPLTHALPLTRALPHTRTCELHCAASPTRASSRCTTPLPCPALHTHMACLTAPPGALSHALSHAAARYTAASGALCRAARARLRRPPSRARSLAASTAHTHTYAATAHARLALLHHTTALHTHVCVLLGCYTCTGRRSLPLATWLSGLEVAYMKADLKRRELVMECGISTQYLVARVQDEQRAEAQVRCCCCCLFISVVFDFGS